MKQDKALDKLSEDWDLIIAEAERNMEIATRLKQPEIAMYLEGVIRTAHNGKKNIAKLKGENK